MSNLKKVLSVGLASTMVMGMVATSAAAATYDKFSDKDEIVNKDAVSMVTELGIIAGLPGGNYGPKQNIDRASFARLVCVALNGGKEPNLGNLKTSFTDTQNNWAEKYIAYCVQQGIIAGKGNNTFAPAANVTGSEAAKMLLVALGYNTTYEKIGGATWQTTTDVLANKAGLYKDLGSMNTSEPLTRDNAAQMIYNTLNAVKVKYEMVPGISANGQVTMTAQRVNVTKDVNGTTHDVTMLEDAFDAVKVEGVVVANEFADLSAKNSALSEGKTEIAITNGGSGEEQNTFKGTQTFSVSTDVDLLGKSITLYVKDDNSNASKATVLGNAIVSEDNQVVVDASSDSIADVADDNKLSVSTKYTQVAANYGNLTDYTGKEAAKAGVQKVLIDNDNDDKVDVVLLNTYSFGKVTSYVTSGDGSITVSTKNADGQTDAMSKSDKEDVVGFDDVKKNDYVMAAMIGGKLHVEKAESVTGTLEAYKSKDNVATKLTVGGTDYKVSVVPGYTGGDDDIAAASGYGKNNLDNEGTFYLDKNGYIVAVGDVSENAYNYALVLAEGTSIDERVKVVLSDGTSGTYTLNDTKLNDIEPGKVYNYSLNSKNEIKLTTDTTIDNTTTNDASFTKGKGVIKGTGLDTYTANSNTVFFYGPATIDGDSDIDVYNGYNKAPTLESNKANADVYVKNGRVMAVVFKGQGLTSANVSDNLYIYSVGTSTNDYTNAKAFVAGSSDVAELKVSSFPGSELKTGVYTYTIDSDGNYELKAVPGGNTASGKTVTDANSDRVVLNDGTVLTMTSKTLVVNDSEYLDDPVAELGGTVDDSDKIAHVVYNLDNGKADEALLIVIKNKEEQPDVTVDTYTKVTDNAGTLTIDHYQATLTTAEIQSVLKDWAGADKVSYNAGAKTATFTGGSYDGSTLDVVLNHVVKITVDGTEKYVDDAVQVKDLKLGGTYVKVTKGDNTSYAQVSATTVVADGTSYEGGYNEVTVPSATSSLFSNTTETWTVNGETKTNGKAYAKEGQTVVLTWTVDDTGFTAGSTTCKAVAQNGGEAAVKTAFANGTAPTVTKTTTDKDTINFTASDNYKTGVVTFTWTVGTADLTPSVSVTNN